MIAPQRRNQAAKQKDLLENLCSMSPRGQKARNAGWFVRITLHVLQVLYDRTRVSYWSEYVSRLSHYSRRFSRINTARFSPILLS